jgi:CRP-like cAMP-binding protein
VTPREQLEHLLSKAAPLSEAALAEFWMLVSPRNYATGEHLLEAGARAELSFFISRGLVREYYLDAEGSVAIRTFVSAGDFTGSLLDQLSNAPAVTWIQALEPVEALVWRTAELDALAMKHPMFQLALRRAAERVYVRKARREHDMLVLTAAERYANWLSSDGHLDGRITMRDLASYLGITPEHLSRLRSKKRPSAARSTGPVSRRPKPAPRRSKRTAP